MVIVRSTGSLTVSPVKIKSPALVNVPTVVGNAPPDINWIKKSKASVPADTLVAEAIKRIPISLLAVAVWHSKSRRVPIPAAAVPLVVCCNVAAVDGVFVAVPFTVKVGVSLHHVLI